MLTVRLKAEDQFLPQETLERKARRGSLSHTTKAMLRLLIPALIGGIGWLTIQTHDEPLPGSHLRVETTRARPIRP